MGKMDLRGGYLATWPRALIAAILYSSFVAAIPTITFPINSQVPPVARISQPFILQFSASTFHSTLNLDYKLSNAPSWLTLDSSTRTLSGTPPASDADTAPIIQITASDTTGSVTMNTTLVISGNAAPTILVPLESQLPLFGTYSPPSSILYYPSTPFKITFNAKTFSSSGRNFYAVTLENTPLPSWVTFDPLSLTFAGTTPDSGSLIQPPQLFGIQLVASDVLGFSGTSIPFLLVVTNHQLSFSDGYMEMNATAEQPMNTTSFRNSLLLDGKVADSSIISNVTATTPSWLTFDNSTFTFGGTPPATATSQNVSVIVTDIYGDVAEAQVAINITHKIFSSSIKSLNATAGSAFSQNFTSLLQNPSDITLTATISPATSWLSFNPSSFTLVGVVPSNAQQSTIQVTLLATSKLGFGSETQSFSINVISATLTSLPVSSTTSASPTTSTTTSQTAATGMPPSGGLGLTRAQLAAAVIVPLVVLLLLSLLILYLCARRRRQIRDRSATPEKSDISNPMQNIMTPGGGIEKHPALRSPKDFHDTNTDGSYTSTPKQRRFFRRSHTFSASTGPLSMHLRDSMSGARSFSDNPLPYAESSWCSTQDSAHPTPKSTSAHSVAEEAARNVSRNFSRKAGVARLARENSSELVHMDSTNSRSSPYSGMMSKGSIQQTPDFAYDTENIKIHRLTRQESYRGSRRLSRRGTSSYLSSVPGFGRRLSGIGHGVQKSFSGSSVSSDRRYSRSMGIGHGYSSESGSYGPPGFGLVRDSSWITIQAGLRDKRPQSRMTAVTESTDMLYSVDTPVQHLSLKMVPKSPVTGSSTPASASNPFARPISRRNANSPFFGGSSSRASSRRSAKLRNSRSNSDPPAVPDGATTNKTLENSIMRVLRDVPRDSQIQEPARDSLGITYGNAREGTRQLRSFVSSVSQRLSWSRTSQPFSDSDSRFRSADNSPHDEKAVSPQDSKKDLDHGDEDYYDEHYRESMMSFRDSRGNSIHYDIDESPELGQAVEQPSLITPFVGYSNSPSPNPQTVNVQEKLMKGPARRPTSVDMDTMTQQSFAASHFDGGQDHEREGSAGPAFL